MKTKQLFKPALLSLAVASAFTSGTVLAQDANQQADNVEVIAVKGIRGSLIRAQAVKQDSTSIVEAISAEDIGKLPDSSIAESLARLPGLAGERVNGRTSGISVRGFKEDFVGTSINGREAISIGDNRNVEYDLYPSEIMTGATVHKSASATLLTQGIGGTVDLQTVRPLNAQETLTVTGIYEASQAPVDNPEFDDTGHRYALSFVEKFADDTIGLALTIASTESPNNQRKYEAWGYSEVQRDTGVPSGEIDDDGNPINLTEGTGQIVATGINTNAQSTNLERDTISAVLQFQPNDNIDIVVDYLNIDYSDSGVYRGFIESSGAPVLPTDFPGEASTTLPTQPTLRTDTLNKIGELNSYGVNIEYALNDDWSATVDYSYSEADKLDQIAQSYAGLSRSSTPLSGTRDFTMSSDGIMFTGQTGLDAFGDPASLQLTGPQAWGNGLANLESTFATPLIDGDEDYRYAQDGFNNKMSIAEELTQFKVEVEGNLDHDIVQKVTFGLNYSERYKDKINNGKFATARAYPGTDSIIDSGVTIFGTTDLTWAGLGNVVAYSGVDAYNNGYYTQTDGEWLEPDRFGDSYVIEEEVTTLYFQADFETEIGGLEVFGNFGAQYVDTSQSSRGTLGIIGENKRVCDANGDAPSSSEVAQGDPLTSIVDLSSYVDEECKIQGGADYSHFLPSFNINSEVADNTFVRFAASKSISRARVDQMRASGFVKYELNKQLTSLYNEDIQSGASRSPWTKVTGNPELKPLESNNFDLSVEKYFDDEGYIAGTLFYKDIVNYTRETSELIDFTNDPFNNDANYYIPSFHNFTENRGFVNSTNGRVVAADEVLTPPTLGTFTYFEDGLKGSVSGLEVTANVPLSVIDKSLDGFGVVATATFIDAELDNGSAIPGQSDEMLSLIAYYENDGFEARIAMTDRSGFETYQRGDSNKIDPATRDGIQVVDAQISYDFENAGINGLEGLRVSLQGTNILDDADQISRNDDGFVTLRREFGPTYMLNVNYSFW